MPDFTTLTLGSFTDMQLEVARKSFDSQWDYTGSYPVAKIGRLICRDEDVRGIVSKLADHPRHSVLAPMITTACAIGSRPVTFQKLNINNAIKSACRALSGSFFA